MIKIIKNKKLKCKVLVMEGRSREKFQKKKKRKIIRMVYPTIGLELIESKGGWFVDKRLNEKFRKGTESMGEKKGDGS